MARFALFVAMGVLAMGLVGCDAFQNYVNPPVEVGGGGTGNLQAPPDIYNGPRARMAVSAMTGAQSPDVGRGMADMLVTELVSTNRFVVVERAILPEIAREIELSKAGMTDPSASVPSGKLASADLLIVGNITGFQPNADGISTDAFGLGYHGGAGVGIGLKRSYVAMDLRIVDVRTSAVVATTRVSKYSTDWGVGVGGFGGGWHRHGFGALGGGLGIYQGTPMEKAIRACLQGAVQFICQQTPPVYYRYDAQGSALGQPQGPPPTAQPPVIYAPTTQPPMQPVVIQPGPQPAPALPAQVYVAFDAVRALDRPSGSAVMVLPRGTALRVQAVDGDWYHVQFPDGKVGWVMKSYTSPTPPK